MSPKRQLESTQQLPNMADMCRYFSELSPQPMVAIEGLTQTICYVNPAFCELVGKPKSAMIDRPYSEVIAENRRSEILSLLDHVFRTGEPQSLADQEQLQIPGHYWSYSCWTISGVNQSKAGVMVQVTDSTDNVIFRKTSAEMNQSLIVSGVRQHELTEKAELLNQKLQVATQAKNQFLASVSHEIRTPINVILGFAELLCMRNQTEAEQKSYVDRIKRQADLLLRLIDDILDLSKVEAGRLEIEKIEVSLPELLADIRMVMQHLADEKGLRFSMTTDDTLPATIISDPVRLKQILTNIIVNAIKFTSDGSVHVRTWVDQTQQKLHFTVNDTGSGMTPEQAARIFQPFTQADVTTTRKFGGTGLGLDLARRLAQALGGDVVMVTTQAGVGTVFEISVDLEGPTYKAVFRGNQKPTLDTEVHLNGLNVLVADDGPDNQYLVSKYLTLSGAHADIANDGEEAVAMAMKSDYDIILMDIQMPNLDGYQATTRLRELGCKVPVVAITAHAMRSEIEKCRLAGCDAYLSKPLSRQALVDMVHRLTDLQAGSSPALEKMQDSPRPESP